MKMSTRSVVCSSLLAMSAFAAAGWADVSYSYDDGSAERAIGIDPGEDSLWFNRFAVAPGGEVINSIAAAFGRPGIAVALNGLPIKVLLYEDIDGGSPWNATLVRSAVNRRSVDSPLPPGDRSFRVCSFGLPGSRTVKSPSFGENSFSSRSGWS